MTLKDRAFTAVLLLLSFLSFMPQYVSSKIIAWMDMMFYFLPFHILPAELLRTGTLPLWNPYIYCGQPLLANMQSAVLYPPDMLFYVLPADIAVKLLTLCAFFIMAFSMYMFMRLYEVSEEGSLLGAFLFSFTIYMTVKAVELADLHSMVWLPAVLYFVKKYAMRGKITDLFFIAVALSLSFLGGHAQVFANGYLLFAAYYFFETVSCGRKGYARTFFAVNAVFILIVLMQALPTAEFIAHSKRMAPEGMGYQASLDGYMKLDQLVEMFFPFIVNFLPKASAFLNWMGLIDIGALAMFLAALGAGRLKGGRYGIFLISVFTVAFCFSFMGSVPFYRLLWDKLFFLKMIRYPAKINLLFFFTLCVMAGHGFDELFRLEAEKLKKFTGLILSAGAAVLALYVLLEVFRVPLLSLYKRYFVPLIKIEDFIDKALIYDSFIQSFLWYVLVVEASVFLLYMTAAKGVKNTAMKYTVLIAAMVCAVSYNRGGNSGLYADLKKMTSSSAALDFLANDRDLKNKRILAPGIFNQLDHDIIIKDLDALFYYNRDTMTPNVPMYHKIANADGFDSLIPGDFFILKAGLNSLDAPWDHPAFSLLNVKYISSTPELKGKYIKKKFRGMSNLYEYARPCGPAYFIPSSSGWPAQGRTEKIGGVLMPETSLNYVKSPADLGIIYNRENVNVFDVAVTAPEKGTLVISENYFPGWNAYDAAKKIPVFRANVCFMAVSLAAGAHKIIFRYEPLVFAVSAWLSSIALGLLAAAGLLRVKSQKYEV